jgi:hypothetical protein
MRSLWTSLLGRYSIYVHARWAGRGVGLFGIAPGSNRSGSSCIKEIRCGQWKSEMIAVARSTRPFKTAITSTTIVSLCFDIDRHRARPDFPFTLACLLIADNIFPTSQSISRCSHQTTVLDMFLIAYGRKIVKNKMAGSRLSLQNSWNWTVQPSLKDVWYSLPNASLFSRRYYPLWVGSRPFLGIALPLHQYMHF